MILNLALLLHLFIPSKQPNTCACIYEGSLVKQAVVLIKQMMVHDYTRWQKTVSLSPFSSLKWSPDKQHETDVRNFVASINHSKLQ